MKPHCDADLLKRAIIRETDSMRDEVEDEWLDVRQREQLEKVRGER